MAVRFDNEIFEFGASRMRQVAAQIARLQRLSDFCPLNTHYIPLRWPPPAKDTRSKGAV